MSNKISYLAAIAVSLSSGLGFVRVPYNEAHRTNGRARKSSGGRGHVRINTPRYKAWKKAFGGLAVPQYIQ